MAACNQCGKPAAAETPMGFLCLDHYHKLQEIVTQQHAIHATELNRLSAEFNAVTGMNIAPQVPVPQPILKGGRVTINNFKISDSVIGAINTGEIQKLDVAVGDMRKQGNKELADALTKFTEELANSKTVAPALKNEMIEQTNLLATETNAPKGKRKVGLIKAAILGVTEGISKAVAASDGLVKLWDNVKTICDRIAG